MGDSFGGGGPSALDQIETKIQQKNAAQKAADQIIIEDAALARDQERGKQKISTANSLGRRSTILTSPIGGGATTTPGTTTGATTGKTILGA